MLYYLEDVKNNDFIITTRRSYNSDAGRIEDHYLDEYPYDLYYDCDTNNKPGFNLVHFRRFCDRNLKGDVIYSWVDKSYAYRYYLNPEKTWDYSFYQEKWYLFRLNFELLCDLWKVKKTYSGDCGSLENKLRKDHHDWTKNEHIDCSDDDKYWDPRWKMIEKLKE